MLIPNCTQIPNKIIDEIMPLLSDTEFRVLIIIARQTFGWVDESHTHRRKEKDWISYSQLKEKTGRHTAALVKAVVGLEEKSLIEVLGENGSKIEKGLRNGHKLYYRMVTFSESETNLFGKRISESEKTNSNCNKIKEKKEKNALPLDSRSFNEGVEHILSSAYSSKTSLTPCTEIELWQIATKKNVPLAFVKKKHQDVLGTIEEGNKYRLKTVYYSVLKWVSLALEKGHIQQLNEFGRLDLEGQHPDEVEKRNNRIEKMKQMNLL